MRWLRNLLGVDSLTEKVGALSAQLADAQALLNRIEALQYGGRGTYVGNGRVLTKSVFPDWTLAYLVEGNDRLISSHLITYGRHEDDITNFFLRNVGLDSHCLDLGANIGYFACIMGRRAWHGKTIAVEADPLIWKYVDDNLHINFIDHASEAICGAVSDTIGELTLHRRVTRSGNTSIIEMGEAFTASMSEPPSEKFVVPCFTIDSLLPKMGGRVDFIKIDVEGAEVLAFRGAAETIRSNPQIQIIMEWSPGQFQAAGFAIPHFIELLQAYGLSPSMLNTDGTTYPISYEVLAATPYLSGVLLTVNR